MKSGTHVTASNNIEKFLKDWGQNIKGYSRKYIRLLQEELEKLEIMEEEESLPLNLLERKSFVQKELVKFLEEEESYWHRRANSNWLLKGDNNTTYFHRIAMGKKGRILFFVFKEKMVTLNEMISSLSMLHSIINMMKNVFIQLETCPETNFNELNHN